MVRNTARNLLLATCIALVDRLGLSPPKMSVSATVTVVYGSENYTLDCYLDQPAALFRCQLWSASGLHPEEQHVTGLVTGVLSDESSLLSVTPGTWVLLQKRAPPTPTPAPVPPAPTHPSMMGGRGLEEMAARISSGFETARLHHDPDQLAAAREVIPWDSKILPRARELEAEYCARIEAAEHERDQKCAEGRSLPAAAAGAAIDRVRFVPIETREFTCPLLQLARLRLFDTSGVELLLVEAECQAGRSPEGEEPLKAIDGSVETKWLSHGRHALEAALGARGGACVASYALTTGNDAPERDPVCWRLEGRLFPTGEWALLDERVGRPQPVPVARKADLLLALERPCERSHLEPPECPSAPTDGPLPEPAAPAAPAAPASSPSASTAAPEHDSQLGPESAHDGAVRGTSRPTHDTSTMPESGVARPPDEWELRALLAWFKFEFFSWCHQPACEATGGPTEHCGMGHPTAEERAGGAGRVELYRGPTGHVTRFPRYNVPSVLLRTRRGRCGEFANCFTLCCRAVGFDARWVLDVTDHVWTEVYLPSRACWVHADPSENVLDAPLMYERGWGKKLSYVEWLMIATDFH